MANVSFKTFHHLDFERSLFYILQATMPSSEKHPSHVPMWNGVKASYTLIAACLFPLAIGGYWAYGQLVCNILRTKMCKMNILTSD